MKDLELLQYVHETAAMGVEGLQDISQSIHNGALMQAVQAQVAEYSAIAQNSGELLHARGEQPKDPSLLARISSEVMSTVETLADSSTSKIAELVIRGNTMGVTKGIKHLHDYEGDDRKVRALAEQLLEAEEKNIAQMKPFL